MSANRRQAYDIVAGNLCAIGYHLQLASEGEFGYFMDTGSLIGLVSLNPEDWFQNTDYLFQFPVHFNDLPQNDRYDIVIALESLFNTTTEKEFKESSVWCKKLGNLMDQKYLETFLGPISET